MTEEPILPRRRGRPPAARPDFVAPAVPAPATNEVQENVASTDAGTPTRRRRASVGGLAPKLAAPSRPGYHRRFFNDTGNRIAEAMELGYTPVQDTDRQSTGLGANDDRLVGTQASGAPLRAILMETPDELYAEGVAEKEAYNRQIDEAIVAGRDSTGQLEKYEKAHGSISSDR